jgi:hypothetical protein
MRARDLRLAVGALVTAVAGVAGLVFGHGSGRLGGLLVLLFAFVLAIPPLAGRLAARAGGAPLLDRVEHDGALQPALVIPGQAIKLRLIRYGAVAFAVLGLMMAITASAVVPLVVGVLCAAVFGTFALLGVRARHRPYRIALLPTGLRWDLGMGPGYVPWDDIARVRTFSMNNSWFLTLDARAGGDLRLPGPRGLEALNRAIARADASIALEAFPVEPARLADVVAGYAEHPESRREIGTERSLAAFGEAPPAELTGSSSRA